MDPNRRAWTICPRERLPRGPGRVTAWGYPTAALSLDGFTLRALATQRRDDAAKAAAI